MDGSARCMKKLKVINKICGIILLKTKNPIYNKNKRSFVAFQFLILIKFRGFLAKSEGIYLINVFSLSDKEFILFVSNLQK
ncbi:hypothetical protein PUN28_002161 [Cardiocondyla obscurior]|uniref:Uncharacterized protein n=1 Tax=Cardiocondyla obscurior TaxID=286306 RepID=A0AAW2GSQ2_9HYME